MAQEPIPERSRSGLWVIGGLFFLSTCLAVFAAFRFSSSSNYLQGVHEDFQERGASLTVDQCVDDVLAWRTECEAMKSLCDSNVERMMDACMAGQDRSEYCDANGEAMGDSHFVATACREHGVDRSERGPWKFCGMAYRAIDYHCKHPPGS